MAYCRVLLCNINKKLSCCNGGFLFISNKHLVTFHFSLAIYLFFSYYSKRKRSRPQYTLWTAPIILPAVPVICLSR